MSESASESALEFNFDFPYYLGPKSYPGECRVTYNFLQYRKLFVRDYKDDDKNRTMEQHEVNLNTPHDE
jgi:hypothetical protein